MNRKQTEHDRAVLPRIQELKAEGRSLRGIAQQLEDEGVPTARPGGRWTHIAVGRILDRAERTPPEEASPPPPQAEQPPSPTEQTPPPAEPPPAPATTRQENETQIDDALDQLSAHMQDKLGTIENQIDQQSARVQNKLGTIESQVDERLNALNWTVARVWVRPVCVGLAICLGVALASWGLIAGQAYKIESQREKLAELKSDIKAQQATLRELEKQTWGVGFVEATGGKYITWPGHYTQPFKGKDSDPPVYAGKWVAKLSDE